MKVFGLIGFPLSHSFSLKYFSEKFTTEGTNSSFRYKNFELKTVDQFSTLLKSELNLEGLNVTAPYKTLIIPYLDDLQGPADEIQAVNTIKIFRDHEGSISRLTGYNTDITGFMNSLQPLLKPNHTGALVLGTGGASKAVKWVLQKLMIPYLSVSRAFREDTIHYSELNEELIKKYPVIINTTPVGSYPYMDSAPMIPYEYLTESNLLFDLIYNPGITLFLQKGKAQGATIKNGLEMLQLQADAAWEIWTK